MDDVGFITLSAIPLYLAVFYLYPTPYNLNSK